MCLCGFATIDRGVPTSEASNAINMSNLDVHGHGLWSSDSNERICKGVRWANPRVGSG